VICSPRRLPKCRGASGQFSSRIVRALKEKRRPAVWNDDARMKSVLTKEGFWCKGGEWKRARGALSLWVTG